MEREVYATLMKQELEVLEKISHPYIVSVYDLCEDAANIYVVSELLPQGNLLQVMSQMCASKTPFSERDAANLVY